MPQHARRRCRRWVTSRYTVHHAWGVWTLAHTWDAAALSLKMQHSVTVYGEAVRAAFHAMGPPQGPPSVITPAAILPPANHTGYTDEALPCGGSCWEGCGNSVECRGAYPQVSTPAIKPADTLAFDDVHCIDNSNTRGEDSLTFALTSSTQNHARTRSRLLETHCYPRRCRWTGALERLPSSAPTFPCPVLRATRTMALLGLISRLRTGSSRASCWQTLCLRGRP
jgi:hypothetical protein